MKKKQKKPTAPMSPEAQNLAICLALGWHWTAWGKREVWIFAPQNAVGLKWSGQDKTNNSMKWPIKDGQTLDEAAHDFIPRVCPDNLSDLNAMHEAEKVLKTRKRKEAYHATLCEIVARSKPRKENEFLWQATAAQRAEAFLRTLKLWDDSK